MNKATDIPRASQVDPNDVDVVNVVKVPVGESFVHKFVRVVQQVPVSVQVVGVVAVVMMVVTAVVAVAKVVV